jgi:hypothetical protein
LEAIMQSRKVLWSGITAGLIALGGCSTTTTAPPPARSTAPVLAASPAAPTTAPDVDVRPILLNAAIHDVENAEDIGATVAAYARGVAIDPDSLLLNKAYVLRMIELEVPDQALDAAQKVLARQPADGLSRGVLAFTQARSGQMVEALTNISLATKQAPDDAFVQDTAGHLLAWYDRVTPLPPMPNSVRDAVRHLHATLDNEVVFGAAYQDAALYYLDQRRQQQQPAQANANPAENAAPPAPAVSMDGPVGGTAAGPVMFAPTGYDQEEPAESPDEVYEPDILVPLVYGWEPGFFGAGFVVVVPPVFHAHPPIHHRHRGEHRPSPVHHHDAEFTFRDRFFGRGYRSVDANGGRGTTALAYLHDRYPGAFPMTGAATPQVANRGVRAGAGASSDRVVRGLGNAAVPTNNVTRVGVVRESQLRVSSAPRVINPGAPGGVISGSPGYTHYAPNGPSVGGAVNMAAPGVNPASFGAIGLPPGFIAVPVGPVATPGRPAGTPMPGRAAAAVPGRPAGAGR